MALTKITSEQCTYKQGATGVVRNLGDKLRESVSVNDFSTLQEAANAASAVNLPLELMGGTYTIGTLTLTSALEIIGRGAIRKTAGTTGHLISTTSDLIIDGDITLDQNASNCPNGSATYNSDCAINHTGARLILRNVTSLNSVSSNINSSATNELTMTNCNITGGYICVRAVGATTCKVQITGGKYSSSTVYDNIQVLNSLSCLIDGIESHSSNLAGIVLSNAASHCLIANCHVHTNEAAGIVCSVSVAKTSIVGNVCRNNQLASIQLDTTDGGGASTNAYIVVSSNICDGENTLSGTTYSTSGIIVNGALRVSLIGNLIRKSKQAFQIEDSNHVIVSGNSVEDCSDGYFLQLLRVVDATVSGNQFKTILASGSAGAIEFNTCSNIVFTANTLSDMGAERHTFKVTTTTDYKITNNTIIKETAGSPFMVWVVGVSTDGYISGNKFESSVAAWQYYINGTGATVTGTVTKNNEITCTGVQTSPNRYILSAAAIVADGDTINNVKDYWSVAPTICTIKQGQVAGIAGALKMWNGAAWV